jgi:hypothetical protein
VTKITPYFLERGNLEEVFKIVGGSPAILAAVVSSLPMPPSGSSKGVLLVMSKSLERDVVEIFGEGDKLLGTMLLADDGRGIVKIKSPEIQWRQE